MGLGCRAGATGNPHLTVQAGRAAQPLQPTPWEKEPDWLWETPEGPDMILVP